MTISAVVFDIGRVLIAWEPEQFYDREIGKDKRITLLESVPLHDANLEVDRGAPFKKTITDLAERHSEWAREIMMWHDRWIEMVTPDIPHSARLLRALRAKGIPVLALSNFGIETFEIAKVEYPVLTEFDQAFISGHLKCIKPDAEIYEILERETAVSPTELLFADDRPENIEAAAKRGWQTHLFTTPEGWAERLVQDGLLTKEEAA